MATHTQISQILSRIIKSITRLYISSIDALFEKHMKSILALLIVLFIDSISSDILHYDVRTYQDRVRNLLIVSLFVLFVMVFIFTLYDLLESKIRGSEKPSTKGMVKELRSIIVNLFKNSWRWIESNFITIVIAIVLVFVFMYYEDKLARSFFHCIRIIIKNKFGVTLLWVLFWGAVVAFHYYFVKKTTYGTLSDGRTFFLSLVLCSLFAYCTTKYPWGMVDQYSINKTQTIDPETINPIIGYEDYLVYLFFQFALCFLVMPVSLYFIVGIKKAKYTQSTKSSQTGKYLIDSPIISFSDDELHFENHVRLLKKRIEEIPNSSSHSIAITGGWGTGKTSFLNLLQQELITEDKYDVLWFNPLKSSKTGNIQSDFFDVLENTLSKYKMGFGRRIKYYKELIGAIDNKYVSFLVKLGNIQLEDEKNRINEIIKMVPKKIIAIIDDVDRLKADEIIQVFKLVGFNAEFDNVVFLLALDKKNVIETLGCANNFPDKFFEMEFPLPNNYKYFTMRYFVKKMENLVKGTDIKIPFLNEKTISEYTTHCINNMRDANRFLNNFVDRVNMICKILDVRSYYLLSLIQYKYPSIYEKIQARDKRFLKTVPVSGIDYLIFMEENLSKTDDKLNDILIDMLKDLFPSNEEPNSIPKTGSGSINQSAYFDYYFNDTSIKAINDNTMIELLSSPTPEELKKGIEQYTNDNISKQYCIELFERHGKDGFIESLLSNKNSELLITNYYKACNILPCENGLNYTEDLAPVKVCQGKYVYIKKDGEIAFPPIECDIAHDFSKGRARFELNGFKTGFVDKEGNYTVRFDYKTIIVVIAFIIMVIFFLWLFGRSL